ncbi:unnamed protein product [Dibothriocephalus latus]|uniref:Uncharacterized protein n=1 Tax=Dibothriocephalus latus TaxID=60516 RepID=A0A3P7MVM8_DIBLA|nr:unnamed protein product [Dibothriocephalus latus]
METRKPFRLLTLTLFVAVLLGVILPAKSEDEDHEKEPPNQVEEPYPDQQGPEEKPKHPTDPPNKEEPGPGEPEEEE